MLKEKRESYLGRGPPMLLVSEGADAEWVMKRYVCVLSMYTVTIVKLPLPAIVVVCKQQGTIR